MIGAKWVVQNESARQGRGRYERLFMVQPFNDDKALDAGMIGLPY